MFKKLREVLKILFTAATLQCVLAIVVSAVIYCNRLLYGVPAYLTVKILTILNIAPRLIYCQDCRLNITLLPRDNLH